MKRVLITGANSYIGTSFESWVKDYEPDIETETLDMRGEAWKSENFYEYDAIFHVAGIAHADVGRMTEEQKQLYYAVNTDLTVECAKKARKEGVKQFIFMSSIIVYGESAGIGKEKVITRETVLSPANFYGDSKKKAEEGLLELEDENFKIVILRPPMIYGKNSKGNYSLLAKMAGKLPIFPREKNQRSMLYIGNLCKFVSLMVTKEESGIFYPQNKEYVCTTDMVETIAKEKGKKILLVAIFHPFLLLLGKTGGKYAALVNKAFGNLVYEKNMSEYSEEYCVYSFQESIRLTEKGNG